MPLKGLEKLVSNEKVCSNIRKFLNTNDLLSLLEINSLKVLLLKDLGLFSHIKELLNFQEKPASVLTKDPPNYTAEQKEINQLIDKYVHHQHVTGTQIDTRIKTAVRTLLNLQKSTDIQNSNSAKYNSAAELVISRFPFDKTLELLSKSTSMFAKSAGSMNE